MGAQKAGTTSLLRYLSQHPELCGHFVFEFTFFDDSEYGRGWEWAHRRYFYDWVPGKQLIAKHAALSQSEQSLARLAKHSPHCRLIFILRDPVERAFSSYRMERKDGGIVRPFEHILSRLDAESSDQWRRLFLDQGNYAAALRRIYRYFEPDQLTVLIYEEFVVDPLAACRQIFGELGVVPEFAPDTSVIHNSSRVVKSQAGAACLRWLRTPKNPIRRSAKRILSPQTFNRLGRRLVEANEGLYSAEELDPEVRAALGRYYRPLNEELEELLGRELSGWTGMGGRSGASSAEDAPDRSIAEGAD